MSNQTQQLTDLQPFEQSMNETTVAQLPILSFLDKKRQKKSNRVLMTAENKEYEIEVINSKVIQNSFAIYEIRIRKGTLYWIFQTRYSLLESLNSKIPKNIKSQLPKFPEKKAFGNLEASFISNRANKLDSYLKELFKLGGSENVVREFVRQTQKAATEINDPQAVKYFRLDA